MKENSIEEDIKILKELGQKYYKNDFLMKFLVIMCTRGMKAFIMSY